MCFFISTLDSILIWPLCVFKGCTPYFSLDATPETSRCVKQRVSTPTKLHIPLTKLDFAPLEGCVCLIG